MFLTSILLEFLNVNALLEQDVVAVEGEVVEEEEAVVDSTDRMDHRTMQLLK